MAMTTNCACLIQRVRLLRRRTHKATRPLEWYDASSARRVGCHRTTQVADHKDPLVVQYYRDGSVNVPAQRAVDAVQPHCPTCSATQGGQLGAFGKAMREFFGF